MADTLLCPNCQYEIEVSTVLSAQLRHNLRQKLEDEAKQTVATQLQELHEQVNELAGKLAEAQAAEVQVRKDRRDLEARQRELELAVQRQLDEERNKIRQQAKQETQEENRLREADHTMLVAELRRQIDVLKRKAEQGSQQVQGEVMEVELEDLLREHFPTDLIEAVPRGIHGGDVLQHVYDHAGTDCGAILWESKRTKAWNDSWLPKLRDDQRAAKAHLAVLATIEMPKGLATLGHIDGIWVTNRACLLGLAAALRAGLVEVASTRRTLNGQQTKTELLYSYFSGPEFRQRIEGIIESFTTLRSDLDAERRSVQRLWAKREKQLDRAMVHTVGFYGDLSGILGGKLPQIPNLELAAIPHAPEAEEVSKAPWE